MGIYIGKNDISDSREERWNMYYGPRESALVESYVEEFMSMFAQQVIVYYAVDNVISNNVYNEVESISYKDPVEMYAQVQINDPTDKTSEFGYDREATLQVWLSLKQVTERINFFPKIGDVVQFDNLFYEIFDINDMKFMFGIPESKHAVTFNAYLIRDWNTPTNLPIVGNHSVVPPR